MIEFIYKDNDLVSFLDMEIEKAYLDTKTNFIVMKVLTNSDYMLFLFNKEEGQARVFNYSWMTRFDKKYKLLSDIVKISLS